MAKRWRPYCVLTAWTLLLFLLESGTAMAAECSCRYFGQSYKLGETVCLRGPNGLRLARCAMNLNNTSWQPLDRQCPLSVVTPPSPAAHPAAPEALRIGERKAG